jgi:hypothetical protein
MGTGDGLMVVVSVEHEETYLHSVWRFVGAGNGDEPVEMKDYFYIFTASSCFACVYLCGLYCMSTTEARERWDLLHDSPIQAVWPMTREDAYFFSNNRYFK